MQELPRTIHFRTRAGPRHGYGNVYRLLGLAERFRALGIPTIRFLLEGPGEAASVLRGRGFDVVALPEDLAPSLEARILAREWEADVCIAEMLDLDLERQAALRRTAGRLVILDDLLDQRYDADLVVCGQDMARDADAVERTSRTRLLTGYRHFLLPERFLARRKAAESQPETVRRLLVAFGGGRYDLAWIKAARAIAGLEAEIDTTFVLGPAARSELGEEIRALVPTARILAEGDLPSEFSRCDLAVTSAGYLKIEAAATGTPCLQIATQWHQIPLGERFAERVGAPYLGVMPYVGPRAIQEALRELAPRSRRVALARRGLELIDGRGADRVLPTLLGIEEAREEMATR